MANKKYKTIIVEDEQHDLNLFLNLIKPFSQIKVVETADDVENAIAAISYHKPDLIFLDIDLYGRSSFEVLDIIAKYNMNPVLIFTTAYPKYMKEAFHYSAFEFLLKPIDPQELEKTINRMDDKFEEYNFNKHYEKLSYAKNNLIINNLNGFDVVKLEDIVMLKASEGYTDIYLFDNKVLTSSKKIGEIFGELPKENFFRSHRSCIINISKLIKVEKRKCILQMANKEVEADIAKESRKELQRLVQEV